MTTRRARSRSAGDGSWAVFEPWDGRGPDEEAEAGPAPGDGTGSQTPPGREGGGPGEEAPPQQASEEAEPVGPVATQDPGHAPGPPAVARLAAPRTPEALAPGRAVAALPVKAGSGSPPGKEEELSTEPDVPEPEARPPASSAGEAPAGPAAPSPSETLDLDTPLESSDGAPADIPWDPSQRTPAPAVDLPPAMRGEDPPVPDAPAPDPADDPAGFVRSVGLSILERVTHRLSLSGHDGAIQDLLDVPGQPSLRLLVWPRPDLLQEDPTRTRATLEAQVRTGGDPAVRVRYWQGQKPTDPVFLGDLPPELLTEAWLEERMLDGLRLILDQA